MVRSRQPLFCFCFIIISFKTISVCAQPLPPKIVWEASFGGSDVDEAQSVVQTSDKGFIIAGRSFSIDGDVNLHDGSGDSSDVWLVKLDSNGKLLWQESLGGKGNDIANCVRQTKDGGYIFVGSSNSNDGDVSGNHGGYDYWIVKTNGAGAIEWQESLGGKGLDNAFGVEQTSDDGFIVAGFSSSNDGDVSGHHGDTSTSDFWVIKLGSSGVLKWQKSLGGSKDEEAYSISLLNDGGCLVAGSSNSSNGDVSHSHGDRDFWIVRLDSLGILKWEKSFGGTGIDVANSIQSTSDGGCIVAGYTLSIDGEVTGNHGASDYLVVKLDQLGNKMWNRTFGGSDNEDAFAIRPAIEGGYVVTGITSSTDGDVKSNHGDNDYWILKIDDLGNIIWQKSLGGTGGDYGIAIIQCVDSGFLCVGNSNSTDGEVTGNHGYEDFWVVKLGGRIQNEVQTRNISVNKPSNYPNPFREHTTIMLNATTKSSSYMLIYNSLGEELRRVLLESGMREVRIERNGLPSGIYIYHFVADSLTIQSGTMIIE